MKHIEQISAFDLYIDQREQWHIDYEGGRFAFHGDEAGVIELHYNYAHARVINRHGIGVPLRMSFLSAARIQKLTGCAVYRVERAQSALMELYAVSVASPKLQKE